MRETLPVIPVINCAKLRPTYAHLISYYLTDGCSISYLRRKRELRRPVNLGAFLALGFFSVHQFRAFDRPDLCSKFEFGMRFSPWGKNQYLCIHQLTRKKSRPKPARKIKPLQRIHSARRRRLPES